MEIASDEIQPSWAQGFTHGWEVAEEYEITGGVLRGKGPSRRMYFPMMHPEIPGEVAKLRREDEAGVLEFARAYGSLRSLHVPDVLCPDKEHWPGAIIAERGMISRRNWAWPALLKEMRRSAVCLDCHRRSIRAHSTGFSLSSLFLPFLDASERRWIAR